MSEYGVVSGLTERTEVQVSGAVAFAGFPAVVLADDGALVAIYRTGTAHLSTDGEMVSRRSTDGGKTWGSAVTVATSATRDYRDGNITKLANGDLRASVAARTDAGALITTGANVYKSTDNGASWSALATEIGGGFTQWQYAAGPIWQLASGDLLLPLYGHNSSTTNENIGTLRSSDNGATWGSFVAITSGTNSYTEWSMVETSAQNLEGWIRHNGSTEWRKITSTNDGVSWSGPTSGLFGDAGGRPHLLLRDGNIFAVFRSEAEAGDPMRVCYKRVGFDFWQWAWRLNAPKGNKGSYGAIAFLGDDRPVVVYGDEASDTDGAVYAAVAALKTVFLEADAGSYTVTGSAAETLRALLQDAAAGAYAVTGAAAETTVAVVMNAESGTYTVTGEAATTLADLSLNAESGTYTYTGAAAGTLEGVVELNAESGTYTYTGAAAETERSFTMNAASGTYTVSGAAATTLKIEHLDMDAEGGSYGVTGTSANTDLPVEAVPLDLIFGYWDALVGEWVALPAASVQPRARVAQGYRRRWTGHISTDTVLAGAVATLNRPRAWDVRLVSTYAEAATFRTTLQDPGYLWFGGDLLGGRYECRAEPVERNAGQFVGEPLTGLEFTLHARRTEP